MMVPQVAGSFTQCVIYSFRSVVAFTLLKATDINSNREYIYLVFSKIQIIRTF